MSTRFEYRDELITRHTEKAGFRGKINAKCIECIYDPYQQGSWRYQVEKCTCPGCPLFLIRPTSSR